MADVDQEAAALALLALYASMAAQDKLAGQFSYARRLQLIRHLERMLEQLRSAVPPPSKLAEDLPRRPFSNSGP